MYATLSLDRLIKLLVWPFALVVVALLLSQSMPQTQAEWVRLASSSVAIFAILMLGLGAPSGRFAPWRIIWRTFPFLNEVVFPDLNGRWTGTTSSNWPLIDTMRQAAMRKGGLTQVALDQLSLQEDQISVFIRASFFKLHIKAELSRTGSVSHSLSQRVIRDDRRGLFELFYVYRQETPEPVSTDESAHLGAAALDYDPEKDTLVGCYWTTRSWRQALNTAGRLSLIRQRG